MIKKEVLVNLTDQYEKYNHMFVNVSENIFKERVKQIIDKHIKALEKALNKNIISNQGGV